MTIQSKAINQIIKTYHKTKSIFCFPHVKACLVILVSAFSMLCISFFLDQLEIAFWSSLCSNIFAGLITGFVLCLISGIKQRNIMLMKIQKKWLEDLCELLKEYMTAYKKIRMLNFKENSHETFTLFDLFYDTGVHASNVNSEILQSTFDKTIPFNPREFCLERLNYDAFGLIDAFEDLHINLHNIDFKSPSSKEIIEYFNEVHPSLCNLQSAARRTINELDIRLTEIQKTIV